MPDPIVGEPQYNRAKIRSAMERIAAAVKEDTTIEPLHAIAALQNVLGHLIATTYREDGVERGRITQQTAFNIPLYVQVYLQGERRIGRD